MQQKRLLLNCDMGESFGHWTIGHDDMIMPYVDQSNIACGYHAGDHTVMHKTVALAAKHNVMIGAHPSYPDRQGFGRRSMRLSANEVTDIIMYQIGALEAFCRQYNTEVTYVKPHGALYNDIAADISLFIAALKACAQYRKNLPLMTLAIKDQEPLRELAKQYGVPLLFEAFADRAYDKNGSLTSREQPNSVYHDPQQIITQALALAKGEAIRDIDGDVLNISADSLCFHGDNPESITVVKQVRQRLNELNL